MVKADKDINTYNCSLCNEVINDVKYHTSDGEHIFCDAKCSNDWHSGKNEDYVNTHYPLFDEGLYTEVVHQDGERAIKILKGNYKDVIYQYGKINFIPRETSEIPTIDFERAVRSCPEDLKESISDDEQFNQLMGNILIELLANQGLEELKNGI